MRVDIHTFSFGSSTPVYGGYIEMEEFNADRCWELCNWTAWADEKPDGFYSEIGSCSHAICFPHTETEEKWLALSFGWLVGDSLKSFDYVERHKNDILWFSTIVITFFHSV